MARSNTVKVSDDELLFLKERRREIFGTDSVPLGEVIAELCNDFTTFDKEHEEFSLEDDFKNLTGKHILIGGRQVGKTTVLTKEAERKLEQGKNVLFICQSHRMCMNAIDCIKHDPSRERTRTSISIGSSRIDFLPARDVLGRIDDYDVVIVDEASYMDSEIIYNIDDLKDKEAIIYASTPIKSRGFFELWGERSPEHTTWHVPCTAANHIDRDRLAEFREVSSTPETEVDAKYYDGDEPSVEPDHKYR